MLVETETQNLPSGASEPLNDNTSRVESFDSAIAEAKKNLEAETKQQIKRGRGRPRKLNKSIADGAVVDLSSDSPSTQAPPPVQNAPQMDFKPILNQSLKMPFDIWAQKAKNPALKLTDEECEAPAYYADQMLNYYAPRLESMDPGRAAMIMFGASLLILVGQKAAALNTPVEVISEPKTQNPAEVTVETAKTPIPPAPEGGFLYNSGRY